MADFHVQFVATRNRAEEFAASGLLIGLDLDAARTAAAGDALVIRVIADDAWEDGPRALTADLRANRINVRVLGGRISEIDGVY